MVFYSFSYDQVKNNLAHFGGLHKNSKLFLRFLLFNDNENFATRAPRASVAKLCDFSEFPFQKYIWSAA